MGYGVDILVLLIGFTHPQRNQTAEKIMPFHAILGLCWYTGIIR